MWWLLAISTGALFYIYAGYPLLLRLLVSVRGARSIRRGDDELPHVSLVISAFNEAATIREKLQNSLALDYPRDRIEIVVISDASDDGTDDIVRELAGDGVRLCRQDTRRGKTAGLNRFAPELSGDIVVFSDANAMYERAAVRMLVRNFADPDVGCVTGEARYLKADRSAAGISERAYWDYEIWIKRLETAVGSMVGGDGAMYAIRKALWRTLPESAINDFLNPLQIVADGWRGIYEPEAICYEATAGGTRREWNRRVRIVSRSWRAVFQASAVLNPFRVGLFALCVVSHKVLRWLTGVFLAATVASCAVIVMRIAWSRAAAAAALMMLVGAIAGWSRARRLSAFAAYYVTISAASVVGVAKGMFGSVSGVWTTPRAMAGRPHPPVSEPVHRGLGLTLLAIVACSTLFAVAVLVRGGATIGREVVFWAAVATLVYVYAGYPLLLGALRLLLLKPVRKSPIEATVCVFIAANDEASVIESKLRNCLDMDYPASRLSIVVASDGSVDGTNEIVRAFARRGVRLLEFRERRGKISAINEGMQSVDSEIVVFSDANTFLDRGALRALVRNFADETVGAVSGDVILVGDRAALGRSEDLYYRYERWLQRAESEIGSMLGVDGALYAIRRSLFVAPPADTILDDMAIPMAVIRAGHRVVFEPSAIAHERGSNTAAEEFSRKTRVVAGAVQFLLRRDSIVPPRDVQAVAALVSHKALRWLSPVFAGLAFAAAVTLAGESPIFLAAAVAQSFFLAVGLLGCIPAVRRWNVVGIAHYFWLVQAAAAVGFFRGLSGRQAVAWRRYARAPLQLT